MPELPEVLTIKKDLNKEIKGKKVTKVVSLQNYALRPSKSFFEKYVVGHEILEIDNIAKLITIKLSSGYFIATHLNMSGRLLYNTTDPYIKIRLTLDNKDEFNYSEVRMFGYFEVWENTKVNEYKAKYAKTALDESLNAVEFMNRVKRKTTHVKDALLDQKIISGIGNIYANDALFMSKIHPQTKPANISENQYKLLFENVQKILNEGIEHRGSTIDRFCDIYGKSGTHQLHFRIYQKKTCPQCNKPIEFIKLNGRGTYICPICQPKDNQTRLL